MMIDINAHKLTNSPGASQFTKLLHKALGIFCESNDGAIHIDDKCVTSVYFGACWKTNIWIGRLCDLSFRGDWGNTHLQPQAYRLYEWWALLPHQWWYVSLRRDSSQDRKPRLQVCHLDIAFPTDLVAVLEVHWPFEFSQTAKKFGSSFPMQRWSWVGSRRVWLPRVPSWIVLATNFQWKLREQSRTWYDLLEIAWCATHRTHLLEKVFSVFYRWLSWDWSCTFWKGPRIAKQEADLL